MFTVADAVRYREHEAIGARGAFSNPPHGAAIHYFLKTKPAERITLEIFDGNDRQGLSFLAICDGQPVDQRALPRARTSSDAENLSFSSVSKEMLKQRDAIHAGHFLIRSNSPDRYFAVDGTQK